MEFLLGGVDVAIECTGSGGALDLAMRTTKAGGRVVVSGIPDGGADLTPWFRELELVGAYTAGVEDLGDGVRRSVRDGDRARLEPPIEQLVGATYPLDRWRDALDHAMAAGSLGTFKVAFAPQDWEIRCRDPDSCWRWTSERPRSSSTRARLPHAEVPAGDTRRVPAGPVAGDPRRERGDPRRAPASDRGRGAAPELLKAGMKLTIAVDDISIPLPPMTRPDIRQRSSSR